MDWKRCINERQVKPVKPDHDMAASLKETSENKALSSNELKLKEKTAAAKISLSYDSVRELLEAIALIKGYKIYNHICYVSFLKEILAQPELGEDFDTLRKIRNDINYYGEKVSVTEAQQVLRDLAELRKKLLTLQKE